MFRVTGRKDPFPQNGLPAFILKKDGWDDFGLKTQYSLTFLDQNHGDVESDPIHIGNVKILKLGQVETLESLLSDDFEALDESFCSIGQSLDYYERLAELGPARRDEVLLGLHDLVRYPEFGDSFRAEKGWHSSLFRDFHEDDEFIVLARSLLSGDYTSLPADDLSFTFQTSAMQDPIQFDFTVPKIASDHKSISHSYSPLPKRISVLIGRNGSGKSTFLARLARVAHGSLSNRICHPLVELGEILPRGIGFPRILTISYSAFDSFRLPGISRLEQEQIVRDIEKGEGRFVFCGLRDIAEELKQELAVIPEDETDELSTSTVNQDRLHSTLLKPIDKLADEFVRTLSRIKNKDRDELFNLALEKIFSDPSFNDMRGITLEDLLNTDSKVAFLSWSTGHKIVMQIVSSITAYAEPKSLILIDEPETHLHPPLLAALMHAIRSILKHTKSFAIVATHSSVVLQETLTRHIAVIAREGNVSGVRQPAIETFGENIGMVTSEVFGLNSEVTDFHTTLDKLVKGCNSLDEIEVLFENGGLSLQARAYVMSLYSTTQGALG